MIIDCDDCAVRGAACKDCAVSVLIGVPGSDVVGQAAPGSDVAGQAAPGSDVAGHTAPYSLREDERAALDALADAGLAPRLRLVPIRRRDNPGVA
jgi:hypothetical protein